MATKNNTAQSSNAVAQGLFNAFKVTAEQAGQEEKTAIEEALKKKRDKLAEDNQWSKKEG